MQSNPAPYDPVDLPPVREQFRFSGSRVWVIAAWLASFVLIGLAVTELSYASYGAGHGTVRVAGWLFPWSTLIDAFYSGRFPLHWVVMHSQFPLYGVCLALAQIRGWLIKATVTLVFAHVATATILELADLF